MNGDSHDLVQQRKSFEEMPSSEFENTSFKSFSLILNYFEEEEEQEGGGIEVREPRKSEIFEGALKNYEKLETPSAKNFLKHFNK